MKKILLIIIISFVGLTCFSQNITNVEAKYTNGKIYVTYNLSTDIPRDITLSYSGDRGISYKPCKSISGDVKAQSSGKKQIIWDMKKDGAAMQFGNFIFRVEIEFCEMVFVEGGTFTMGCTSEQGSDCENDEKQTHEVALSSYYIGKYLVTQQQWKEIMESNPSYFKNCDECPVENVSWNEVQGFIKKLNAKTGMNYRLLTEAEWEFAARGGNKSNGYKYSGSNNVEEVAWYSSNSNSKTHPVGQKKANELGIYDMSGNVWEWCSDWYGTYSLGSQNNPTGASSGSDRVFRGGSWYDGAKNERVSNRCNSSPDYRNLIVGFRLAHSSE